MCSEDYTNIKADSLYLEFCERECEQTHLYVHYSAHMQVIRGYVIGLSVHMFTYICIICVYYKVLKPSELRI